MSLNDPKYNFHGDTDIGGYIVNDNTGEAIPPNEPVFVLRARDRHAIKAIAHYLAHVEDENHRRAVIERLVHFSDFADAYPDKMKEPDS